MSKEERIREIKAEMSRLGSELRSLSHAQIKIKEKLTYPVINFKGIIEDRYIDTAKMVDTIRLVLTPEWQKHARLSVLLESEEVSKIQEALSFLKSCGWLKSESLIYYSPKMSRAFSATRGGRTFGTIIRTMDELGYDVEWQVCNSKNFGVPQNRERVFIIGHLRGRSFRKVFPFRNGNKEADNLQRQEAGTITTRTGEGTAVGTYVVENKQHAKIKQIGNCMPTKKRDNPNQGRVYDINGLSPCLNQGSGGGR